jgi:proteasome accessory factor A
VAERLMGIETEYAVSALYPGIFAAYEPDQVVHALLELARRKLVHLPDIGGGMFMANGARFYLDYGNHPELTTPECANPWDVVRYVLAGERIISGLAHDLAAELGVEVMVFKSNVDYGSRWVTWGCHESYMHRASPYALSEQIIPHLVTRIIYTGAGGFNTQSDGLDFTLSPRVPHLSNVLSNNSTSDRGIFHTKDESLTRPGFHRLHVICGESLCSETSMWLKVATTSLVVAMIEAGLRPGKGVGLRSPLQAMQTIASDSSCSALVDTVEGARLSALEIQYHYLSQAEKHLGDSGMPPWAHEVCIKWREILNCLLEGPEAVAERLDWGIKRELYASYAESQGVTWDSLPHWNRVIAEVRNLLDQPDDRHRPFSLDSIMKIDDAAAMARLTEFLNWKGLSWDAIESVLRLRQQLFEIDTRFGQLGGGVFQMLDQAGVLKHHVVGVDSIEDSMSNPPATGRARVRGNAIRRLSGAEGKYQCDWQGILDVDTKRLLDLSEPFETSERWLEYEQAVSIGLPAFIPMLTRFDESMPRRF